MREWFNNGTQGWEKGLKRNSWNTRAKNGVSNRQKDLLSHLKVLLLASQLAWLVGRQAGFERNSALVTQTQVYDWFSFPFTNTFLFYHPQYSPSEHSAPTAHRSFQTLVAIVIWSQAWACWSPERLPDCLVIPCCDIKSEKLAFIGWSVRYERTTATMKPVKQRQMCLDRNKVRVWWILFPLCVF